MVDMEGMKGGRLLGGFGVLRMGSKNGGEGGELFICGGEEVREAKGTLWFVF